MEHTKRVFENKDKWWDMLSRFIDVLRINLYIVDEKSQIILPPEESKYGGRFLAKEELGFDLIPNLSLSIEKFFPQGKYLEARNRFDLFSYAIPIELNDKHTVAYVIVGPVILNRKSDVEQYKILAEKYNVDSTQLIDGINEIRIVSNVMMNSILDLLSVIVRDSVDLTLKDKELDQLKVGQNEITQEFKDFAHDLYSEVQLDEMLITLLDIALKITQTECGSIMVLDADGDHLSVKASRGLNSGNIDNVHLKLGEGIAGLAALENTPFLIRGDQADNRIKPFLKRSEIKHSLVMPLVSKDHVFGILNLHTKENNDKIDENLENLKYLSKLLSSAL